MTADDLLSRDAQEQLLNSKMYIPTLYTQSPHRYRENPNSATGVGLARATGGGAPASGREGARDAFAQTLRSPVPGVQQLRPGEVLH